MQNLRFASLNMCVSANGLLDFVKKTLAVPVQNNINEQLKTTLCSILDIILKAASIC